jgi:outer membrane protein assembly factor BamB
MTPTRKYLLAGAALGILGLTACSSLPSFGGNGKAKELAEAEKAGRITMVLSDDKIEANPELATPEITLPPPTLEIAGHRLARMPKKSLAISRQLKRSRLPGAMVSAKGPRKKSAISTPPVASTTTIYTLDAGQEVVATDISSGNTLWRKKLKGLSKRDKAALGGGLAVDGDTLIVSSAASAMSPRSMPIPATKSGRTR